MNSNRPYNFTPTENWSTGQWHDSTSYGPERSNWNRWQPIFPRPPPPPPPEIPQNTRRVVHDTWLPVTERPHPVPSGVNSFPYPAHQRRRLPHQHPPVRVLVPHDDIPRHASYPRPSQLPFDSPPPWFQQNQQPNRDESKLSPDEQKATLNKLKKEIYNPVQTKVARQVSLYFRGLNNNINNTTTSTNDREKDKDEDGKRCAICLEDFVAKEMVNVTPCNHMFHEECIVPWVTNNGSCPVCRFAICERMKQNTDSSTRTITNTMPHDLRVERDLISIMRAFDDTFELENIRSILLPRLTRG